VAVRRIRGAREVPLFSALLVDPAGEAIVSGDGDVRLYRGWLGTDRADALLAAIRATTVWKQERRKMYDRVVDVPREQAWFGDGPPDLVDGPMIPELARVRADLEALAAVRFAYVLLNRYRDGADSVAWHNDREVASIERPTIASLTLGATRAFDVRPKADRSRVVSVDLDHGDLVVMRGDTQANYEHRVGKDKRVSGERINLTFRQRHDPVERSIEQEFDSRGRRGKLR
jgi:alkylated DNA repair dioxygenase AlkB